MKQPHRPRAKSPPRPAPKKEEPRGHWRDRLGPLLAEPNYQPLDAAALARRLRVPVEEMETFTGFLTEEEKTGRLMQVRHSLYVLPRRLGFCVGNLQMNERGFGFLVPLDPAEADFYIAGEDTGTAFHGDLVLARLKEKRGRDRVCAARW